MVLLSPVLDGFDTANKVTPHSSRQNKPKMQNDIEIVVSELVRAMCFAVVERGRKHQQFSNPKDILNAKDKNELLDWLVTKLPSTF